MHTIHTFIQLRPCFSLFLPHPAIHQIYLHCLHPTTNAPRLCTLSVTTLPSLPVHVDEMNHVCYSIHSAAYLKKGDANSTIELNPDFAKGYSRKGAALHALKCYNDAVAAFKEGLAMRR